MSDPFPFTRDAFLGGRVLVCQPAKGFRSGLDAVFLAAACNARPRERVLEAGCGSGAASLCLLARVPSLRMTGIEIDPDTAQLARKNAAENGFADDFNIVTADLTAGWPSLQEAGLRREAYDHVIANPPYHAAERSRPSAGFEVARARVMEAGGLDRWLRFLAGVTKPHGTCTVIHVADALPELLNAFEGRFGAISVVPLYPKANASAIRVILSGVKGSRAPLSIAPGVVLHGEDGSPTEIAKAVLADGAPLAGHSPSK